VERRQLKSSQLARACIPKRYYGALVSEIPERNSLQLTAKAYVSPFKRVLEHGHNLYIFGPNGTGKSYMACAIAQDVIRQLHRALFMPSPVLKTAWATDKVHYESDLDGTVTFRQAATEWELLILDDLGREWSGRTGYAQAVVDEVLRARYYAELPTIITANMTTAEFGELYGEAALDLLHEDTTFVPFDGVSRRRSDA